jgi:hypothetical protein
MEAGTNVMEYSKRLATAELLRLGFEVDEIPCGTCGTGKRADLHVKDGTHAYHIEAKDKFESQDIPAASQDGFCRREDPITHNNRISGILTYAKEQLSQTPKADATFQLIWLHAESELQWRLAFATFYGHRHLRAVSPRGAKPAECFYFTYNAAYSMPDVEALILTEGDSLHLCMNEFSHRRDEFRSSRLYEVFSVGEIDPVAMETAGKIIACRADISRKNPQDVLRVLKEQTGVDYLPIALTRYSFWRAADAPSV